MSQAHAVMRSVSCSISNSVPSCNTDTQFTSVIDSLRAAVPRPLILSLAAYSIGAYGWGQYVSAQPIGSHTGAAPLQEPRPFSTK